MLVNITVGNISRTIRISEDSIVGGTVKVELLIMVNKEEDRVVNFDAREE